MIFERLQGKLNIRGTTDKDANSADVAFYQSKKRHCRRLGPRVPLCSLASVFFRFFFKIV